MSRKQWVWLLIAIVLFAGTGALSVTVNARAERNRTELAENLYGGFSSGALEEAAFPPEDFIARVDIEGTIASADSGAALSGGCDPEAVISYIDRLITCGENVGILLNINSGGGTMNASDEIYLKLMDYKEATGRPVYAYFGDTACSGAYYIAMAADEIWANRNSLCVNIGVYISTYNLSGLFEKYGIEEIMIRSSENKGIGSLGTPWTEEQLAIYQSIVDLYYQQFLDVVAQGRNMTPERVKALDDGREMLAAQALEAGFVDGIGRYEEYEARVLGYFGPDTIVYEQPEDGENILTQLVDWINGRAAEAAPRSDGELLRELAEEQDGIVVMAYAG